MDSKKGLKPSLPFWLSPTQVRFLPVKDVFIPDCIAMAKNLPGRVDVDDREMTIGKKIRDAEREWVPLIIVFGDNEKQSRQFQVRMRGQDEKSMTFDELTAAITAMQKSMPFEPLALPMTLDKRIVFRG
jgi:threonyl-tRNA synthetase